MNFKDFKDIPTNAIVSDILLWVAMIGVAYSLPLVHLYIYFTVGAAVIIGWSMCILRKQLVPKVLKSLEPEPVKKALIIKNNTSSAIAVYSATTTTLEVLYLSLVLSMTFPAILYLSGTIGIVIYNRYLMKHLNA